MNKDYAFRQEDRGEQIVYTDADGEVWIERTSGDFGQRLHCSSITGPKHAPLPFDRRLLILVRLCEDLNTKQHPTAFVIDDLDKDRPGLEAFVTSLAVQGHQVIIEHDNAEKREKAATEMFARLFNAGKSIKLNGVELKNLDDFEKWKKTTDRGMPRDD